jgi:hypothetical protein
MWLRELVTKVLINPIIRTRTRHCRHVYHPTRDNIEMYLMETSCEELDWIFVVECRRILVDPDIYFVQLWRFSGMSSIQLYLCRYLTSCFGRKLPSVANEWTAFSLCVCMFPGYVRGPRRNILKLSYFASLHLGKLWKNTLRTGGTR